MLPVGLVDDDNVRSLFREGQAGRDSPAIDLVAGQVSKHLYTLLALPLDDSCQVQKDGIVTKSVPVELLLTTTKKVTQSAIGWALFHETLWADFSTPLS